MSKREEREGERDSHEPQEEPQRGGAGSVSGMSHQYALSIVGSIGHIIAGRRLDSGVRPHHSRHEGGWPRQFSGRRAISGFGIDQKLVNSSVARWEPLGGCRAIAIDWGWGKNCLRSFIAQKRRRLEPLISAHLLGHQFGTFRENLKVIGTRFLNYIDFWTSLHAEFHQKVLNVGKLVKILALKQIANNKDHKTFEDKFYKSVSRFQGK